MMSEDLIIWAMRSKVKIKSCGVAFLSKEPDIFKDINFGLRFTGVQSLILISKVKVDLRGQVWPWGSKVIWQKSAVFDHRILHMFYGSYFKFSINFEHSFWPQRSKVKMPICSVSPIKLTYQIWARLGCYQWSYEHLKLKVLWHTLWHCDKPSYRRAPLLIIHNSFQF